MSDVLERAEQAQAKVEWLESQLQAALQERKRIVVEAAEQHSYTKLAERMKLSRQRARSIAVGNAPKKKRPPLIEL